MSHVGPGWSPTWRTHSCVPCRLSLWGRLETCGRLSTGHSRCSAEFERPVDNRPQATSQATSLPHIGSCSFHVDSELPADA